MIYFDNAATTFPKPKCVINAVNECIKDFCGNPGRSSHNLSVKSAEEIYSAREAVAGLLGGVKPESVVFTYNATYALNLAIKSYINSDCHILTSFYEHNSVIRPLEALREKCGISYSTFMNEQDIEKKIKPNTKGIVCSLGSNVTGDNLDEGKLSEVAKRRGLFLILDASQVIGHRNINILKYPCDVLCAPGHKALFGIQGCGFAVFKETKRRQGLVEGGSGSDSSNVNMPDLLPEGYEAGTLATPAIVSLASGIDFINKIGIEAINKKIDSLTENLYEKLSFIPDVKIYKRGNGILSFNFEGIPSGHVSYELNKLGICTRSGLHCAPSIHKTLGTMGQGAVRVSFSYMNNLHEIDRFYKAIRIVKEKLK